MIYLGIIFQAMKKILIILVIFLFLTGWWLPWGIRCTPDKVGIGYYLTILRQAQNGEQSRTVKGKVVKIELAETEEVRQRGLQHRTSLPPDSGMLFVYPEENILSFWMKDTPLPLSIAFIKSDGTILEIYDMQPNNDKDIISSSAPVQYALEMIQGWFNQSQIKAGDTVVFSKELKEFTTK
jgi:uncharacterized membrane protein (UPF0127 family)